MVLEDVIDERSHENDVAACAQGNPNIGHGGRARVAWVDVNDLGALLASLDHPLEADGMVLSHRGAHDQNGVGVAEILLRGGRAAAPGGSAQTGHGGAMSYTGLIADADHPQAGGE